MEVSITPFLKECIKNQDFSTLKLLCLASDQTDNSESKSDSELKHILDIVRKNNYLFTDLFNSKPLIKVLMYANWCSSKDLCNLWNKMSKGNCIWNNIQITHNENEPYDYVCIINSPLHGVERDFEAKKTILFRMEPHMEKHHEKWGKWWKLEESQFLFYSYNDTVYSNVEWHLNKTYIDLCNQNIEKDPLCILSTVLSDKYRDPGHIKRVDFTKFLESKGVEVDIFGGNRFLWKRYKGSLPYHNKDNALLPYKYTFNCENFGIKNYCTEKLYDGILAECLVFYSGCINVKDFVDENAFVYLHLSNFEQDYLTIKKAIEENWWEKRLPYIQKAKLKILTEMQFFPRLENIINNK